MKSKPRGLSPEKIRRQYQRDFMNWLAENRDQFVVEPFKPKATVRFVSLHFPKMSRAVSIKVRANSIVVVVTWKKRFFDMIYDEDISPIWNGNAYRCGLCKDSDETFQDLASMRRDHLYRPFLEWCNKALLASQSLKMIVTAGGSTGASLFSETDSIRADAMTNLFLGLKKLNGQQMFTSDDLHVSYLPLFGAD